MADWDSAQYLKFERERTQPAIDLAARIGIAAPQTVLDLGCGPGNSTQVLRERFPHADILGVDSSPGMIEQAKRDYPTLAFQLFDANDPMENLGKKWDVIFSNACIQWVPDHAALLPRLLAALNLGGELAVQIPLQEKAPMHRVIQELSASPEWAGCFPSPRVFSCLHEEEYCALLDRNAAEFSMWQTDYFHILPSHQAILEWYRGTGLRPYLNALNEIDKARFESALLDRAREIFPVLENGSVLFKFSRLFFLAQAQ